MTTIVWCLGILFLVGLGFGVAYAIHYEHTHDVHGEDIE